jgi:hypothetical protein
MGMLHTYGADGQRSSIIIPKKQLIAVFSFYTRVHVTFCLHLIKYVYARIIVKVELLRLCYYN